MTTASLTISFASVSPPPSGAFVQLEQEPVDSTRNYLTKQRAADALNYFIGGGPTPREYCTPGAASKQIYAYPWPANLAYQCQVSKGVSSRTGAVPLLVEETINCDLNDVLATSYPVHRVEEQQWMTETYDSTGIEQVAPTLTINGPEISLSYKVYGTVRVVYETWQDQIVVLITYDNTVVDGETMDPYVLCLWAGGHTNLKLAFADGEETIDCNNRLTGGGNVSFDQEDLEGDGYVDGEDEIHEFDYCTGEELTND